MATRIENGLDRIIEVRENGLTLEIVGGPSYEIFNPLPLKVDLIKALAKEGKVDLLALHYEMEREARGKAL